MGNVQQGVWVGQAHAHKELRGTQAGQARGAPQGVARYTGRPGQGSPTRSSFNV